MMAELFDSEYLTQQYIKADRKKSFAAGMIQGEIKGRAEGETSKALTVATSLLTLGSLTKVQIAQVTGLSIEKVNEIAASLKPKTS